MTPELDPFQHDTLSFLDHARGRAVIADPMGARKTGTTLAWLATQPVAPTLIVAPTTVHRHWAREASRFFPHAFVYTGSDKASRARALDMALTGVTAPTIYLTTYESMKQDQHTIKQGRWGAMVFDEGHRLKGRRTQVALCANDVTKHTTNLIIVTGTPVLNHAAELWQYLHMLAPKVYTAFWKWAEEHYKIEVRQFRGNRFPTRIIHGFREGHEEIVRNQIAPFFIQRDIAELFPGAPWVVEPEHVEVAVQLSPGERKLYENLVKHKWGLAGSTEVVTSNGLDKSTRLNQITSDWGTLDADLELGTKTKMAVELCMDLLERDEPVFIVAKYRATVERIVEALRVKHVSVSAYHGNVPVDIREEAVLAFKEGRRQVIVGTLDSLSEGVDGLQERCSNIIMVDRHWTSVKNDQAIGRLRRSGQLKKVTVWHVFAEGTLDATITAACLRKTNVINMLHGKPLIDAIYGRL